MRADFVEFSLWVEDGRIELVLETLAPKEPSPVPLYSSREDGMRLLNYLLPPSGLTKEEPSQGKRASLLDMLPKAEEERNVFEGQEAETGVVPYVGDGSSQYVKHTETLDWAGFSPIPSNT